MDLLSGVVLPSVAVYLLFALGLLVCVFNRSKPFSWWLLAASGAANVFLSSGMLAAAVMSPLEYAYPGPGSLDQNPEARHIVVLTAWASDDVNLPLSARLNASQLYRVAYALELYLARPDSEVVVSGSEIAARLTANVLRELGIPEDRITVDGASSSTAQSAIALQRILGEKPFLLVTSAGHIPRAMGVLEKAGLHPISAPTDYQLPKDWWYAEAKPTPYSLSVTDLALHEYAALLWYRITGAL